MKPLGWRHESYRHYLASRGVKTGRSYNALNLSFTRGVRAGYEEGKKEREQRRKAVSEERGREISAQTSIGEQFANAPLSDVEMRASEARALRLREPLDVEVIRARARKYDDVESNINRLNEEKKFLGSKKSYEIAQYLNDLVNTKQDVEVLEALDKRNKATGSVSESAKQLSAALKEKKLVKKYSELPNVEKVQSDLRAAQVKEKAEAIVAANKKFRGPIKIQFSKGGLR
jgi:hypothetical protein